MKDVEMLKKYKELLDNHIITQEEFEKKKSELLADSIPNASNGETKEIDNEKEIHKKKSGKRVKKRVIIVVGIIVAFIVGGFGINLIAKHNQQSTRAAALTEAIQPIMNRYGLKNYVVKYEDGSYDVYAEGFESLTNGKALSCLEELDRVSVDDPCGEGTIDFGIMTNVHPGLDVEYSYWRVSSLIIAMHKMQGNYTAYKVPGIYCNRYGTECVYECENY